VSVVVIRYLVGGAVAAVSIVASSLPAAADPWSGGGSVSDAGLLARARSEMNELNQGYSAGSPPNCTDEHYLVPEDGNSEVEYHGHLRWIPAFADDPTPPEGVSNEWYRQICYLPDMPPRNTLPQGTSHRRFENVDPEILAQVAVDDVLAEIPTQTIETNPQNAGMVAIPTWFWVEGVPAEGVTATASIPGVTVTATASPGGVEYDFGDGTSLACQGTGTPYAEGATSDCTHTYERAGTYAITATILWTGTYTVNGGPPQPIETAVARTATFDLAVNEAQAINTRGG
jgi:hypothetical protein